MTTFAPAITRPRTVTAAFWLYIAAAVVNVGAGLSGLLRLGRVESVVQRAQQSNPNAHVSTATLQALAVGALAVVVVVAVIWAALVVAFALQLRRGRNWARVVLTVLAGLTLLALLGPGIVTVPVAGAAVLLSFLPPSNPWFRPADPS